MRGGASANADVIVVRDGERPSIGPAELRLEDGTTRLVDRRLPADLPHGYHQIKRKGGHPGRLIVAPFECYLPPELRGWGWAIQLYAARSRRSWGIGDLAALRRLGEWGKKAGASFALISPLSAPIPLLPQQASPYFASTRLYRNPLFLSMEEVPGAREIDGFAEIARKGAHAESRSADRSRRHIQTEDGRARNALVQGAAPPRREVRALRRQSRVPCCGSTRCSARSPSDSAEAGTHGRRTCGIPMRLRFDVRPGTRRRRIGSASTSGCSTSSIVSWRAPPPSFP